jgi:hypothetical protein
MRDNPENGLGLSDAAIKDLAQRLAAHLRDELGDRLLPLQQAYDAQRVHGAEDASAGNHHGVPLMKVKR